VAEFKVCTMEGTNYVDCYLNDETICAEAGALCYMKGEIKMRSRLFAGPWTTFKAFLADEAPHRPTYTGTGIVTLESSLGGFHVIELNNETWILEKGIYWASEGSVNVSFYREGVMTSFWAGEGLIYLQTKVKGTGKVVLTTRGPIEEMTLEQGQRLSCDGPYVVARREGVSFKIRRATSNFFGRRNAKEGALRVFEGPGNVLINPAPYWRYRISAERQNNRDYPSQLAATG
jgi:uncharacterized protein (AIM24 family)